MEKSELNEIFEKLYPERTKRNDIVKLEKDEKKRLYSIMEKFDADNWQDTLRKLVPYLEKYNIRINKQYSKPFPSLLNQILFYICYKCKEREDSREDKVCIGKLNKRDKYYVVVPNKIEACEKEFFRKNNCILNDDGTIIKDGEKLSAIKRKFADKDIIYFLKMYDINLSHNFFSREVFKIQNASRMYNNINCVAPYKYNGKKQKNLAVAIAGLRAQAKDVKEVIDLFGGSGTASAVMNYIPEVKYVYNELDTIKYVVFKTLAGESWKKVLEKLKELQDTIIFGETTWGKYDEEYDGYYLKISQKHYAGINMEELYKTSAFEGEKSQMAAFYPTYQGIRDIIVPISTMIKLFANLDIGDMLELLCKEKELTNDIRRICEPSKIEKLIEQNDTYKKSIIDIFQKNMEKILTCYYNYLDVDLVSVEELFRECSVYISNNREKREMRFIFQAIQHRNLENIYLLMDKLCNSNYYQDNNVDDETVVALFLFKMNVSQMNTWGTDYNSTLQHYALWADGASNINMLRQVYKFVNNQFEKKSYDDAIESFHNAIKDVEPINEDCFVVLNKRKGIDENVLYYIDSPYVGTKGYNQKDTKVKEFTPNDMKKLIRCLFNSKAKFIFSCRLINGNGNKSSKKKESNYNIARNLFLVFLDVFYKSSGTAEWDRKTNTVINAKRTSLKCKKQELYVLFPCKKGDNIDDILCTTTKAIQSEIFITNYLIEGFRYKDYEYQAYNFFEILEILLKNVLI